MALICVEATRAEDLQRARDWAKRFGVPVGVPADLATTGGVRFLVNPESLALGFMDPKLGKPFVVDFGTATWRARFQQPLARGHIFRRALGVREPGVRVVDATAGFGQDALLAVSLGCSVTAIERSPVVAALLQDGLQRARREEEVLREPLQRVQVVESDAAVYLGALTGGDRPDVVYLDPMFEKPKKTAKSPKEMQLLQALFAGQKDGLVDEAKLFQVARSVARERVVVKRPLKARALAAPSHSFKGQSVRYDVYLNVPSKS